MVITGWWIYRGLRRGLYPALNIFMVFYIPLLFTLNYFDWGLKLVGAIAQTSSMAMRESIGFAATYLVLLGICSYLCLWLCKDKLPLHKAVDTAGGAVFGLGTGIISAGMLLMVWLSLPLVQKDFPIDDAQLFFPAHRMALKMAGFVANRPLIQHSEDRPFNGERFMRDLRYGLPSMQTSVGRGYMVSSIPTGFRIFVDATNASAGNMLTKILKRLGTAPEDIPPSESKQAFAEHSRTPMFVDEERNEEALIAVICDKVPPEIANLPADQMFVNDGEVFYSKENRGDQILFIKIYRVQRENNIGSVIALFQPKDPRYWSQVSDLLPTQNCYKIADERLMKERLKQAGATAEELPGLINQVRLGGKAYFIGRGNPPKPMVIEMGPKDFKIYSPEVPDIEAESRFYRPAK